MGTIPFPFGRYAACRCHYGRVREEGGRQTFKSTPPQSNYRPGHDDAHALFMADAACLVRTHRFVCVRLFEYNREQDDREIRVGGRDTHGLP